MACGGLDSREVSVSPGNGEADPSASGSSASAEGMPSAPTQSGSAGTEGRLPPESSPPAGGSSDGPSEGVGNPSGDDPSGSSSGGGSGDGDSAPGPGSAMEPGAAAGDSDPAPQGGGDLVLASPLVDLVWAVGSEGTGPGFFDDARMVGVDATGTIYVAEYGGPARVQVFDASGAFVEQWFSQSQAIVTAMAVSLQGSVSLLEGTRVEQYAGRGGEPIGTLPAPAGESLDALAVTPDGGLVVVNGSRIVRFDDDGQVVYDNGSIRDVLGGTIFIDGATVDGEGNVFVIETFEPGVFKFNSAGTFVDRLGGVGDGPGLFSGGPDSVAVDGRGRVFAADFDGIEVFESNGNPAGLIELRGAIFGMAVTLDDSLLVLERNGAQLFKLDLL